MIQSPPSNLTGAAALSERLVVIVATTPARSALLRRALASVRSQTRAPDRVVLVLDRFDCERDTSHDGHTPALEVLRNRRTTGAAGAWNTAIDHLLRSEADPTRVSLCFLDDDDWWEPEYLSHIADAFNGSVDVVAGALQRRDARTPAGRTTAPPAELDTDAFLAGNPGVQGSNLGVRLSTIVEAGCFDEALSSCTDRDLLLRLIDLGACYRPAPSAVAVHDTLHGLPRVSDHGAPSKIEGIDTFYAKWKPRMAPHVEAAALARAHELFGWVPTPAQELPEPVTRRPQTDDPITLVIGITVDGSRPERALELMGDLAAIHGHARVDGQWIVMLENADSDGFVRVLTRARTMGLRVLPIRREDQARLAPSLGIASDELVGTASIAVSRTILQLCVGTLAKRVPSAVAWILDDDARIDVDHDVLVDDIARARATGVDVAIGRMTGAPPVPHACSLRVQCVDLAHLLLAAGRASADEAPPEHRTSNARWSRGRSDYYYDLARAETDRVETPFLPPISAADWLTLLQKLEVPLEGILRGEQVFRPVTSPSEDPLALRAPSNTRGGNTFVFRHELLTSIPNLSPRIGPRRLRRSDMLWASEARHRAGALVEAIPICVRQDRSHDECEPFDRDRVRDDIVGYGFSRAFEEALSDDLSNDELVKRARKYAAERYAALALSVWRARGACRTIRRALDGGAWWSTDPRLHGFRASLSRLLNRLEADVTVDALRSVEADVATALADPALTSFDVGRMRPASVSLAEQWLLAARTDNARALLEEHLDVLGAGSEGVVFARGATCVKVFDLWTKRESSTFATFNGAIMSSGVTPRLQSATTRVGVHVVELELERTTEYRGGHGPSLYALLSQLIRRGLVYTNLHPSNLRLTLAGELRIIDVGRSFVRSQSTSEVACMVRRAMIVWRWASHPCLKDLLRRAIKDEDMAEAAGWRALFTALTSEEAKLRLDARLAELADDHGAVLDYGCGKPRALARRRATRALVAFDVDGALAARWEGEAPAATFLSSREQLRQRRESFSTVVCSLLLCTLEDDDARRVLEDIKLATAPGGRIVVAVCDPTSLHVHRAQSQARASHGTLYESVATYQKDVRPGGRRREVHRSVEAYRRLFARAGLEVQAEETIDELDLERFERVGAFILFHLSVLPALGVKTSLLIKVCAMDASAATAQIEHIARALGRPRAFDEIVTVVDTHPGPFARAHCSGDLPGLLRSVDALLARGVVDRVVTTPSDAAERGRVCSRWFGLHAACARAQNGQPTVTFLHALDTCVGELVLHVDADAMVARTDVSLDLIAEAAAVFAREPDAVTLSLSARSTPPGVSTSGAASPFRVEATGGWLHMSRLRALHPLPNALVDESLELPWHRSLDRRLEAQPRTSLRYRSAGHWYATPDNARKLDLDEHMLLLDRIEAGWSAAARSTTSVLGPVDSWMGPAHEEDLVVIVIGRDVPPGRITRCLDSLRGQTLGGFGLIVVDDASSNGAQEIVRRELATFPVRSTFVARRARAGLLANTAMAVRHLIAQADAIVVLVDLDDALASPDALSRVSDEHRRGADLTVGSMLRTDRPGVAYPACFDNPRGQRGGNVWQHLRSFRKGLFDQIDERDMLDDDGQPFELATDWAFMLPLVELAKHPVQIREALYLHEPGEERDGRYRRQREAAISQIVRRPRYPRSLSFAERARRIPVLCYHRVLAAHAPAAYRARGLVVAQPAFEAQLRRLREDFRILDLQSYQRILDGREGLPNRAVLITFDDGYRDFQTDALPVLDRVGAPAALFVRSALMDGLPSWAPLDLLYHACPEVPRDELRALRADVLGREGAQQLERVLGIARARDAGIDATWRRELYLSTDDVRDLARRDGLAVGFHGADHTPWSSLASAHRLREWEAGARFLESCGASPRAYAFANGDATGLDDVPSDAFELGFVVRPAGAEISRLTIPRLLVPDDAVWVDSLLERWEALV